MSNAAQNWAWQQSGLLSSDKLVLVALADSAWDDGRNAFPSVAYLARKTSLCRRTVQIALRRLTDAGKISESAAAEPTKSIPTTYRLHMDPGAESAPPGAAATPPPAQPLREPRAFDDNPPAHLTTDPRAADAPELRTNQVQEQPDQVLAPKKRATKLPDPFFLDAGLRSWAADKCPAADVNVETEQFVDHHRGKGTTSLDWRATWRTWMRNAQKWAGKRGGSSPPVSNMDAHRDLYEKLRVEEDQQRGIGA